jgi:hypothetical protein
VPSRSCGYSGRCSGGTGSHQVSSASLTCHSTEQLGETEAASRHGERRNMTRPKETLCKSTDVRNPLLSFYLSRRARLRRKLEHRSHGRKLVTA